VTPPNDSPDAPAGGPDGPAAAIIERFGGIRPLAAKLGIPVSTVQGWKKRGLFPANRRSELIAAAADHGVPLSESELDAALSAEPSLDAPAVVEADQLAPPPAPDPVAPARDTAPAPQPAAGPAAPRPESMRADTPRPAPPIAAAPARPAGRGLAALALLLALLALAASVLPLLRPDLLALAGLAPVAQPADGEALRRLRSDVDRLSARVEALAAQPAAAPPGAAPSAAAPATADTAALTAELASLRGRIEALEQAPAAPASTAAGPTAPDPQAVARLVEEHTRPLDDRLVRLEDEARQRGQRLDGVADRMAAVEQHLADAQSEAIHAGRTAQEAADRAERVGAAMAENRDAARQDQALVLAAGQLQSAVLAGRPYRSQLAAVQALGLQAPGLAGALAALQPRADQGVPAEAALQARFPDLATAALRADRQRPDGSWTDQVLGRLSALVTVRRQSGELAGTGPDAVLARAGAALERGDLDAAVAEVAQLQGPAAATLAPWLEDARVRLAARDATALIADHAVERLSRAPTAPAPAEGTTAPAPEPPARPAEEPGPQ
jgi:hypothetical protein